jgi:hypothetical protein
MITGFLPATGFHKLILPKEYPHHQAKYNDSFNDASAPSDFSVSSMLKVFELALDWHPQPFSTYMTPGKNLCFFAFDDRQGVSEQRTEVGILPAVPETLCCYSACHFSPRWITK